MGMRDAQYCVLRIAYSAHCEAVSLTTQYAVRNTQYPAMKERLQKTLAHAGVASRRKSEEIIRQGRVAVNGQVVTELGTKVDPERDTITFDGRRIDVAGEYTYIVLHKPAGVITTADDPWGRPSVLDLVDVDTRVYPVGRLDADSEGLVLLTNDGQLTHQLTHPSFEHEKEYHVLVAGRPSKVALERLRTGVRLEDGITAPALVDVLRREEKGTWLRMVLHEGRKRQIRRMADAVGHPVKRLIRVRIGSTRLGNLPPGEWRHLSRREVAQLREATGVSP
jgi:pseudouridine synthase